MTQPRDIPGAKGKVMSWNDFSCGAALDFHDCALATLPEFHTDEPLTRHTRAFLPTLTSPGSALRHEQPGSGLRQWKEVSRSYTSPVTAHSSLAGDPFSGRSASLNTHGMHHSQALKHRLHGESPPGAQRTWDVVAALAQRRHVQRPSQPADVPFSSSPLSDTSSGPDVGSGTTPAAPPSVCEEADRAPRRRSMDQVVRIMSASPYP